MKWRLKELKEKVSAETDAATKTLFLEALDSFLKKRAISSFYAQETKDLLNEALPEEEPIDRMKSIMRSFFSDEDFKERAYGIRLAYFKAEAHIFSFAQSFHSIADILAMVIFHALRHPKTDKNINLHYLADESPNLSKEFKNVISETITDDSFRYLSDFTNTIKHHTLIKFGVPMKIEEGKDWEPLRIRSFSYRKRKYPEKLLSRFINSDFDTITINYLRIGNALNREVGVEQDGI